MRKYLAAAAVGLALVGTQAAATESAVLGEGDRLGSPSDSKTELVGVPLFALLYTAAFLGVVGWALSDHGGAPASP